MEEVEPVTVDRERARTIEDSDRCLLPIKPRMTLPGSMLAEQLVNARTHAPGRLAPKRLLLEKSTYHPYSRHYTHLVKSTGAFIRLKCGMYLAYDTAPLP